LSEKSESPINNESQIYAYLDSRLDSITKKQENFESKIEEILNKQNIEITGEIKRIEQNISGKTSLGSQDISNSKFEIEKIEKAVNEWTKNIEDQLNVFFLIFNKKKSLKSALNKKVDNSDFERIENKLEEEIERREIGHTKTMEIAARAEEMCNRIADDFLSRIKEIENIAKTNKNDDKISDLLAKQRVDFEILQKSLHSKVSGAIEDMQSEIQKSIKKSRPGTSKKEPELAESFGAKLEKATEGEQKPISPYKKAREEQKSIDENNENDDSMRLYKNYLKKRAQISEEIPLDLKVSVKEKGKTLPKKTRSTSKPRKEQSGNARKTMKPGKSKKTLKKEKTTVFS